MTRPTADAALHHATEFLDTLSPDQLADLVSGRARLEFRPQVPAARQARPSAAVPSAASAAVSSATSAAISAAIETINHLAEPAEVDAYLRRHDSLFTLPVLKEIARGLGPTVRANGRNKADLRRDIVAGTAGYRTRSAAMSGGAWA